MKTHEGLEAERANAHPRSESETSGAQPLRILHICPRPSFSGLEAYALALATGQRDFGHQVAFVVLKGSPLAAQCAKAGLHTIETEDSASGKLSLVIHLSSHLRAQARPDIVHMHSTQDLDLMLPALLASRLVRGKRAKVILQTHIWISHSKRDPLHAISYSLVDEIWCSSEPARATLEKFLPIPKRKLRIVNYGREVAKMEAGFLSRADARAHLHLPMDATVVGTVARIDEGKGTRELLEGTLHAMETRPDLHLILIGPPTADDPKAVAFGVMILDRIATLPASLKGRVHAPGAVADSYKYLRAFDLFALPTYKECFALSLLEAQLAGVPCLATNSGGSPEIVRENETGWLCEPRSVDSLHEALERALASREQWPAFGTRAQERVRKEYDFAAILPRIIEMYRELTQQTRLSAASR